MKITDKFLSCRGSFFYATVTICLLAFNVLTPYGAVAQGEERQSLLWKISGNGLRQPSFLYGTIHAICPQDLLITEGMLEAMQKSNQLVLELNISNASEIRKLQAGMQTQSADKLSNYLTANEYRQVELFYRDSLGVSLNELQGAKPFFISAMLYTKLLDCPVVSYEQQLALLMSGQSKPIVGLETAEEQLKVLNAIPQQEQARMLLNAVQDYDALKAAYWNAVVSYKNKDLESLYYNMRETSFGMKSYEKQLLQDRNRRWIPTVETLLQLKPSFFAVGAGHLPGEDGLISLLRRRGYTVEPVAD